MPLRFAYLLLTAIAFCGPAAFGDEPTRQVQEELRKRNLFYGDIDGRASPAMTSALKSYQERKGFVVTGDLDADTLRSMGISAGGESGDLPNVPVLQSDRGLAEGSNPGADDAAPPATGTAQTRALPSRAEARSFIRAYLNACETSPVNDDLTFYGARVEYFGHGTVTRTYIRNELVAYGQQWPQRQYTIGDTITVTKRGPATSVRCQIGFKIANGEQNRHAAGRTDSTFLLVRRPDERWEIIGQKEERVRAVTGSRKQTRKKPPFMRRMQRTMRKLFR